MLVAAHPHVIMSDLIQFLMKISVRLVVAHCRLDSMKIYLKVMSLL